MEKWRENIIKGDITEACNQAGVTTGVYYDSLKRASNRWTEDMLRVNKNLKEIVVRRRNQLRNL